MVVHGPYPMGESRVMREAMAAIDRGWHVDVVAMKSGVEERLETLDGVRVYRLPSLRGSRAGLRAIIYEYLGFALLATVLVGALQLKRRYNVVQVHNPPDFLLVAALVPRLLGARVVFDIHDFAPELFVLRHPSTNGTRLYRLLEFIERLAARSADAVVTVHQPYQRALVAKGVAASHITVVMNSLDERLLPSDHVERAPRFTVMHHGTMNQHYGIDVLIRGFRGLKDTIPDAVLELHGAGDVVAEACELVRELELRDSVHITGALLPQREVLRLVPRASVGVVANLAIARNRNVLPVKLLEYVALGVPVVSSDLVGIREFFGDDEILFYEAGNPDALAAALRQVAGDPEGALRRAQAASLRYREYRWEVNADRYADLLNRLAGRRPIDASISAPRSA